MSLHIRKKKQISGDMQQADKKIKEIDQFLNELKNRERYS